MLFSHSQEKLKGPYGKAKALFNNKKNFSSSSLSFLENEAFEVEFVDYLFASAVGQHLDDDCFLFLAYLFYCTREGHLCLYLDEKKSIPSVSSSLHQKLWKGAKSLNTLPHIVKEGNYWYLQSHYKIKERFLKEWKRLEGQASISLKEKAKAIIPFDSLLPEQVEAINKALHYPLSLILGGPGTGKSYTASHLIKIYLNLMPEARIVVAAPTGKAAAHLKGKVESNEVIFQTLHSFVYTQQTVLPHLVLIDESSMIDAEIMSKLFSCIHDGTRLVLIGDPYQLPPVEIGNFFSEMAFSTLPYSTTLSTPKRTDNQAIISLSQTIKQGQMIDCEPLPTFDHLIEKVINHLPKNEEDLFTHLTRHKIISALRQGPYGVDSLNKLIYEKHSQLFQKEKGFFPIIITSNDKLRELYNGDLGFIVCEKGQDPYALFKDKTLPVFLLPSYTWAYVLSIHKSQGSEYDEVDILLPIGSEKFGREILYTAVTRAKNKANVYGSMEIVKEMLSKRNERLSGVISSIL